MAENEYEPRKLNSAFFYNSNFLKSQHFKRPFQMKFSCLTVSHFMRARVIKCQFAYKASAIKKIPKFAKQTQIILHTPEEAFRPIECLL